MEPVIQWYISIPYREFSTKPLYLRVVNIEDQKTAGYINQYLNPNPVTRLDTSERYV